MVPFSGSSIYPGSQLVYYIRDSLNTKNMLKICFIIMITYCGIFIFILSHISISYVIKQKNRFLYILLIALTYSQYFLAILFVFPILFVLLYYFIWTKNLSRLFAVFLNTKTKSFKKQQQLTLVYSFFSLNFYGIFL